MEIYPYSSAIILTDAIYTEYGGNIDTSTEGQRNAAYVIAEKKMTEHIGTFLLPTIVTGTYQWPGGNPLVLPYSYINSISSVTVLSPENCYQDCDIDESDGCVFVRNDTYGYVDVRKIASYCGCSNSYGYPYQVRIAYKAGLPTGTANMPDMLLALKTVAEIELNAMIDPYANEGAWNVGIEEFSNQDYREKRTKLKNTVFGNSAAANYAASLVSGYRRMRALKF